MHRAENRATIQIEAARGKGNGSESLLPQPSERYTMRPSRAMGSAYPVLSPLHPGSVQHGANEAPEAGTALQNSGGVQPAGDFFGDAGGVNTLR